jgi:hypothetical protein
MLALDKDTLVGGNRTWKFSLDPKRFVDPNAYRVTMKSRSPVPNMLFLNKARLRYMQLERIQPEHYELMGRDEASMLATEMAALTTNKMKIINVVNALSPLVNNVVVKSLPIEKAKAFIASGQVVGVRENDIEYFIWAKNLPTSGTDVESTDLISQDERGKMVRELLELSQTAKIFDRGYKPMGESDAQNAISQISYVPFRQNPTGVHAVWVNSKEQAVEIMQRLLKREGGTASRVVFGYDRSNAVLREFASTVTDKRVTFVAGDDETRAIDLVEALPLALRTKVPISVLVMGGVDLPKSFFDGWDTVQNNYVLYLITRALSAVPLPASQIPNIAAFRKALEAA